MRGEGEKKSIEGDPSDAFLFQAIGGEVVPGRRSGGRRAGIEEVEVGRRVPGIEGMEVVLVAHTGGRGESGGGRGVAQGSAAGCKVRYGARKGTQCPVPPD